MSSITRCPACGTLFKVVADQLRISEGWVRCGHCTEVFDASAHLQADAVDLQADAPSLQASGPNLQADAAQRRDVGAVDARASQRAAAETSEVAAESEAYESSLNTEMEEGIAFEVPDSQQIEEEAQALVEHPLDRPFEFRPPGGMDIEPLRPKPSRSDLESELESELEAEPEAGLDHVSFVREAERQSFWAQPRIRAALALAALALTILLAMQIAVHERDRLAATQPALRPWLASLCATLGCSIGPPRQIDAIAIDSSSFDKLRGDAYRLNVTLKNQGGFVVAMPALELTLTDGQDRALVRRVLTPAELGPKAGVIAPASEWSGSLAMAVSASGVSGRIAGYRLLAFYP